MIAIAERAAFDRIGAGADLVEQHQRRQRERRDPSRRCWRCAPRTCSGSRRSTARRRCRRRRDRNTGSLRAVRRRDEQPGLRHQRQQPGGLQRHGLAAGVRSGDDQHARRRNQQDVDRRPGLAGTPVGTRRRPDAVATRGISSGCRAPRSSNAPSVDERRLDAVDRRSENRARACSTSSSVAASIVRCRSPARRRNASVSASRMRRTSSRFLLLRARRCRC